MKRLPALLLCALPATAFAGEPRLFAPADVFELEWASDPRISADGQRIAYVRNSMDIMRDERHSEIWVVDFDGGNHRPLVAGGDDASSPRWSPDGGRLLYASGEGGSSQLRVRWMDSGQTARISNLRASPRGVEWSPDGRWIAFAMATPEETRPAVDMPAKPEGAEWAEPPKVIDRLIYRRDGSGYVEEGFDQLFLLPAEGGTPRQLTHDPFHHGPPLSWTPDGEHLVFSANRRPDWEYEPADSEVWELTLADGALRALTDRRGPDDEPAVSPDGRHVAYVGHDDRYQGYQVSDIYLLDRESGASRILTGELDRDVSAPRWHEGGAGLYFTYADHGDTKLALVDLDGELHSVADGVGGLSLGRPYGGGDFDARGDRFVFTHTAPDHPADLATGQWLSRRPVARVTRLNDDLLGQRDLAPVEEIRFASSFDGREIQAWIAKPPGFDPERDYPLVLEIHGGPFADYGARFAAEVQLYAAAGYVVLYANPRGSSGYGEEFGNLIHHAYPSQDYDDLMSAVDAVLERGYVDPERLFVTGGSGGGVLTAWIVGKTDRFRAAVSAKPVINWTSFVFTADIANFFYRYWFPGMPWEFPEQYWRRSPLSLAGNVTTPTMLLTGEADHRTPISESEQFYQALKLQRVDTELVRIPGASHGIARRPSQLIAKVAHILAWFARHDRPSEP
ncbi:MAG: S9 family peptidase [Acidobacteriota bacterium]|nr:S9 family peptidase [Acidobacteriota bacterium]